jgi:dipeptidyl aminopeptidase/acylaminoacyl peptidase
VLDVGMQIEHPYWRPRHDQLVFAAEQPAGQRAYFLVNADGTNTRRIEGVAPGAINDPQFSSDGSKLAYATWGTGDGSGERIHVLDIDTGSDTLATPDADDGYLWQDVLFSPDGTKLLTKRFLPGTYTYQLAIVPADGRGEVVLVGPEQPDGMGAAVQWQFSPDGTQVLATYGEDESTWLLDVDGRGERQLPWSGVNGASWQRLAP